MGAAVFLPASFFSAGALPAGALPPVEGFFSAALGGILDRNWDLGVIDELKVNVSVKLVSGCDMSAEWMGWMKDGKKVWGGEPTYTHQ